MQILTQLEDYQDNRKPVVLTIGNFDGVHRGHLAVLRKALSLAGDKSHTMALTFNNHPSTILRPQAAISLLSTVAHRIQLIQATGVDSILLLPFTNYLANHSAASFVERLRQHIPFTHLVLGHDATLGRDRQGNRNVMLNLGQDWGFDLHYVEEYRFEGHPVSSSRIREILQGGDLEQVEALLGRPYSIYAKAVNAATTGSIHLDVSELTLPPIGTYTVRIRHQDQLFLGIAELGNNPVELQVRLSDQELHPSFAEQEIEVIFQ